MGKDDCTYALRKLNRDCTLPDGQMWGGEFIYRCVHYVSYGVNLGKS
jgi:hypothetical protein